MSKTHILISLFLTGLVPITNSQSLNVKGETSIFISESAILTIENASLNGSFENKGNLVINQSIDFMDNSQGGNVTFLGSSPSVVSGSNLHFTSLTTDSEADIILTTDSLFTNQLSLKSGIIVTGFSYLESQEVIDGGSNLSHIEGTLSVKKTTSGSQYFPIGRDGLYNPISLSSVAAGSLTSVKINIPEEDKLTPGDSLIGINKQFEWEINYIGTPSLSIPAIEFQGIDLTDLPNKVDINAPIYIPVITQFDDRNNIYKSLGARTVENTDNTTFGAIQASKNIELGISQIILSIGLSPTTDKLHFYVPNFFSPNSKLVENRMFRPFLIGTEIKRLNIIIWDQYNRLVFSENYISPDMNSIGWTGGDEPEGAYFYSIELESEDGNYSRKGTVFLGL